MPTLSAIPNRCQAGIALARELMKKAQSSCADLRGLTTEVMKQLEDKFLPSRQCVGRAARDGRGEWEYWRDHGLQTGALMRRMAKKWGGDPELYYRVGYVHDLDYLCFPHDVPQAEAEDRTAHPVPLAMAMQEMGVCAAVTLAVLEHAPYLGLSNTPSSRLSATLSAAEDLTTLAALDPPFADVAKLSNEARRLLKSIKAPKKFHRNSPVRAERNPDRFINEPLALVVNHTRFRLDI